ncbi:MAG: response regulator [Phycisphaerae bacterium]|nr:response regulator [Tepidisphaeraceae bacterium]
MAQRTVLVVEDVECTRRALVRLLEAEGHAVRTACTVREALPLLEGADVAILDLCLPDGSGREVLEMIRREGRGPRVAFWSGSGRAVVDAAVRDLCPDAMFCKSESIDALVAWVALDPTASLPLRDAPR